MEEDSFNLISDVETSSAGETHQEQPWEGRFLPFHPDDEARDFMRAEIMETLKGADERGVTAYSLANETARRLHEVYGEAMFGSGDVKLETSRMWGSQIRMAPDNTLHPK